MLIGKLCMLIGIGKLCMGDVSTGTRAFRGTHTWLHGEGGTQAYTIQSVAVSRPETARRECVRAELWPVRARAMGPVCDEVASAGGGTKAGRGWMFELRRVVHATVLYLGSALVAPVSYGEWDADGRFTWYSEWYRAFIIFILVSLSQKYSGIVVAARRNKASQKYGGHGLQKKAIY